MADDLTEHFARLEWVRCEIATLDAEVTAYLDTKPYKVAWHFDFASSPLTRVYYPKELVPPPQGAQIRTGTLINELRAILDALACTLATRLDSSASLGDVYFPTAKSAQNYTSDPQVRRKIRKLSTADQALIDTLKPYPGGNDLLYTLHSADVLRKHQRLVLFANAMTGISIMPGIIDGSKLGWISFDGGTVKDRPIIAIQPHDYHQELDVSVTVAFAEPEWIKGEPVTATLHNFAREVQTALELFN